MKKQNSEDKDKILKPTRGKKIQTMYKGISVRQQMF